MKHDGSAAQLNCSSCLEPGARRQIAAKTNPIRRFMATKRSECGSGIKPGGFGQSQRSPAGPRLSRQLTAAAEAAGGAARAVACSGRAAEVVGGGAGVGRGGRGRWRMGGAGANRKGIRPALCRRPGRRHRPATLPRHRSVDMCAAMPTAKPSA